MRMFFVKGFLTKISGFAHAPLRVEEARAEVAQRHDIIWQEHRQPVSARIERRTALHREAAGKSNRDRKCVMSGIREVAEQAGVSLGTVSNVLNRPEMVSEATRLRVQAVIEQLGFVRN